MVGNKWIWIGVAVLLVALGGVLIALWQLGILGSGSSGVVTITDKNITTFSDYVPYELTYTEIDMCLQEKYRAIVFKYGNSYQTGRAPLGEDSVSVGSLSNVIPSSIVITPDGKWLLLTIQHKSSNEYRVRCIRASDANTADISLFSGSDLVPLPKALFCENNSTCWLGYQRDSQYNVVKLTLSGSTWTATTFLQSGSYSRLWGVSSHTMLLLSNSGSLVALYRESSGVDFPAVSASIDAHDADTNVACVLTSQGSSFVRLRGGAVPEIWSWDAVNEKFKLWSVGTTLGVYNTVLSSALNTNTFSITSLGDGSNGWVRLYWIPADLGTTDDVISKNMLHQWDLTDQFVSGQVKWTWNSSKLYCDTSLIRSNGKTVSAALRAT